MFVPVGTPGGEPLQVKICYFMGPAKPPMGTNTKVASAKGHFSAHLTHDGVGVLKRITCPFLQSHKFVREDVSALSGGKIKCI